MALVGGRGLLSEDDLATNLDGFNDLRGELEVMEEDKETFCLVSSIKLLLLLLLLLLFVLVVVVLITRARGGIGEDEEELLEELETQTR